MLRRLSFKELSIILGVVVALIITITLSLNRLEGQSLNMEQKFLPKPVLPAVNSVFDGLRNALYESVR